MRKPSVVPSGASTLTLILALVGCNCVLLFIFFANALPIYYYGLKKYLLYAFLPYSAFNAIARFEKEGGMTFPFFAKYFPLFPILRRHLNLTVELHPELAKAERKGAAQFIFAMFPHGCGSDFRILLQGMLPSVLPNIHERVRSLAASVLFLLPVLREFTLFTGCISASRPVAERALKAGRSLIILPGGEAEQLMTARRQEKIYLSKRKGFVKLALRQGVPLVPCYVFGSVDLFHTSDLLYAPRHWIMKNFGVCLPLCWGLGGSLCPLPVKNTVVMGEPLSFKKCADPDYVTSEELDAAHDEFCVSLKKLFDDNKGKYGVGDRELCII